MCGKTIARVNRGPCQGGVSVGKPGVILNGVSGGFANRNAVKDDARFFSKLLKQRGIVPLFEAHDLFFHDLDILRQLEKRFHDLGFGRLVGERGEQRVNACHARGQGVAGGADFSDGGRSVHAGEHVAAALDAQAGCVQCARMKIIVTCGPSYEPIDEVRRITNFSTGQMGSRLARALAVAGHEVTCFRGVSATTCEHAEPARLVKFSTNDDLEKQLVAMEAREKIGAVFHAAALADFKIFWARDRQRKISSRAGAVTLELVPSSKVINELRDLFPKAQIAGWKYELDGTPADVAAKAARQIAENRTDACIMNGAAYGRGYGVYAVDSDLRHVADTTALCAWAVEWVRG